MSDTITITGNLADDPKQRQLRSGATVTTFRVASSQRYVDRESGKWVEAAPNWYDVSIFRALGEHAYASLHRGERVIVTGKLKIRHWETDKSRGTSVEIEASGVGHDLLWGTTQYTRTVERAQWSVPGADGGAGASDTPIEATDGEWSAPLSQGQAEGEPTSPSAANPDAARELVGALSGGGAGNAGADIDHTPF